MTGYARGAKRELMVRDILRVQGWYAERTAGSHGVADVVACRSGKIMLVQVKADARGPFNGFGPHDRQQLAAAATQAGGEAFLCWWPPDRKGPRWHPAHEWPKSLVATG